MIEILILQLQVYGIVSYRVIYEGLWNHNENDILWAHHVTFWLSVFRHNRGVNNCQIYLAAWHSMRSAAMHGGASTSIAKLNSYRACSSIIAIFQASSMKRTTPDSSFENLQYRVLDCRRDVVSESIWIWSHGSERTHLVFRRYEVAHTFCSTTAIWLLLSC